MENRNVVPDDQDFGEAIGQHPAGCHESTKPETPWILASAAQRFGCSVEKLLRLPEEEEQDRIDG